MNDVMTKYEILREYKRRGHPEHIRDTWLNLGGAKITPDSRTFVKDMVYFVDLPTGTTPTPIPNPNTPPISTVVYTPVIAQNPSPNNDPAQRVITLLDVTPGASIYFTLDNSTPSTSSILYDGTPFTVSVTLAVRAMAVKAGMSNSRVAVLPPADNFNPPTQNGYPFDNGDAVENQIVYSDSMEGPWDGTGGGRVSDGNWVPGPASLYGSLILCEASLYNSNPLTWNSAVLEDDEEGFVSFAQGIISPHFRLLLTSEELLEVNAAIPVADPTFIPYSETTTAVIQIPDEELEKILVEAGVPFVLLEELEFPRNKICDDMIGPAMQEYFKFFPIIHRESVYNTVAQAGCIFHVPVPEGAYGAVRVFVNQGTTSAGGASAGNPMHFFASEIAWWGGGSNNNWSPIRYGSGRSPGYSNLQGFGTLALDRAARQGILNYATRCEFHINYNEQTKKRELIGYANRTGTLEIYWAHASNDWNAIEYARVPEVRKLATARVLRAVGMLRGQVKSDIPGALNFDMFINRAKELEDEVMTFWKDPALRAVAIRGSM